MRSLYRLQTIILESIYVHIYYVSFKTTYCITELYLCAILLYCHITFAVLPLTLSHTVAKESTKHSACYAIEGQQMYVWQVLNSSLADVNFLKIQQCLRTQTAKNSTLILLSYTQMHIHKE